MTLATVTGLSAWIVVAAFVALCLWAAWTCRRIQHGPVEAVANFWAAKQTLARLKAETTQEQDWNWPPRLPQQNAPALVDQPRARQARR